MENAFNFTNKVYTFSIHNGEVGFFPGTGKPRDVGQGRGKYYSLNVPLKEGASDEQFSRVFLRSAHFPEPTSISYLKKKIRPLKLCSG